MIGDLHQHRGGAGADYFSQRAGRDAPNPAGIRVDVFEVFCDDVGGTFPFRAVGVVVYVGSTHLSGVGFACGIGMQGEMEVIIARVGLCDHLGKRLFRIVARKGDAG